MFRQRKKTAVEDPPVVKRLEDMSDQLSVLAKELSGLVDDLRTGVTLTLVEDDKEPPHD